jgi:general secretion pathway protein A
MYLAFYSLTTTPFSKENNCFFESKNFKEATARMDYLKQTRGMGLLTGEPGAGKTFALRTFSLSLNPSLFKVIYFPLSTGGVMDFYRGLALGLGEEPCFRKIDLFEQIQKRVLSLFQDKKVTPVFILDEMHMAPNKMLMDLGLLFNFSMDSLNPFILVLSGLPSLKHRLNVVHAQPLNQRIIMRYTMEPMDKDEVKEYIEFNLEQAGAKHSIFSDDAITAVASLSQGWPRIINNICINSLLVGAQARKDLIDAEVIRIAAGEASAV